MLTSFAYIKARNASLQTPNRHLGHRSILGAGALMLGHAFSSLAAVGSEFRKLIIGSRLTGGNDCQAGGKCCPRLEDDEVDVPEVSTLCQHDA